MKHIVLPHLCLFLVLLLITGCGGGHRYLARLHREDRRQLQAYIQAERAQRAAAAVGLRGPVRRTELARIAAASSARIDSLLNTRYRARPFHRNRHQIEHHLGFVRGNNPLPNPRALEALETW